MMRLVIAWIVGLAVGGGACLIFKLSAPEQSAPIESNRPPDERRLGPVKQAFLREELVDRHRGYLAGRSRHRIVLLNEVVAAYMRAEPQECLDLLKSLNAAVLIPADASELLLPNDLDDFTHAFRMASENGGKRGDALIRSAFRRKIAADPAMAFHLLGSLPVYLVDQLSTELARSWGARDGPAAAHAFLTSSKVELWGNHFREAMSAWTAYDADAAFQFLENSPLLAPPVNRSEFLKSLALRYPHEAAKRVSADGRAAEIYFASLLQVDPNQAFELARNSPGDYMRNVQFQKVADMLNKKDPGVALQVAIQTPASEKSLFLIREAAKKLSNTQDPFAFAEQQNDAYQRAAAISGITEGLYRAKGVEGLSAIIARGVAANNEEWLESATSIIVDGLPREMSFMEYALRMENEDQDASINWVVPAQEQKVRDWKQLPAAARTALIEHAKHRGPAERVAQLKELIE